MDTEEIKYPVINAKGLTEIKAILAKHHKREPEYWTLSMIYAWAAEAEAKFEDHGGKMCIEIPSYDALGGATISVTLADTSWEMRQ